MRISEKEITDLKQKVDLLTQKLSGNANHFEQAALSYLIQLSRSCDRLAEIAQSEKRQKLG